MIRSELIKKLEAENPELKTEEVEKILDLFFDQIIEAAIGDASLGEAAAVNPEEKFSLLFSSLLQTLFIERMEQNEDIFARFMNEKSFQNLVTDWISKEVYSRFAKRAASVIQAE